MTEAPATSTLLARLRRMAPALYVVKWNDRTTAGIPDAGVFNDATGRFVLLEMKLGAAPTTEAQRLTLRKLPTHALVCRWSTRGWCVEDARESFLIGPLSHDALCRFLMGRVGCPSRG